MDARGERSRVWMGCVSELRYNHFGLHRERAMVKKNELEDFLNPGTKSELTYYLGWKNKEGKTGEMPISRECFYAAVTAIATVIMQKEIAARVKNR